MRLRKPALRRQDKGEDVVRLQRALTELGYDVGECDGEFGYLTQDGLRQFQREHRLRVDGIAGPQVRAMLYHPELQSTRTVHVVKRDESLIEVARQYGVTVEYLRRSNRLSRRRRLYEGQRLILRCRTVLAHTDQLVDARGIDFILRRTGQAMTGFGAVHLRLNEQGEGDLTWEAEALEVCQKRRIGTYAVVHTWDEDGHTVGGLGAILSSRQRRAQFYESLKEVVRLPGLFAVLIDSGPVRYGDGARFLRWIAGTAGIVRQARLKLYVSIPVFQPGLRGRLGAADLDAARLARYVDGLVVQGHWPTTWGEPMPSIDTLHYNLRRLRRNVPSWKLLLGLWLGAREHAGSPAGMRNLSYQQGMALAYANRQKPAWNEAKALLSCSWTETETEEETPTPKQLWIAGSRSIEAKLHLIERHNLAGIVLGPLGGEDTRIWQRLPRFLAACQHDRSGVDIRIGKDR